jgi:hypothetical protein
MVTPRNDRTTTDSNTAYPIDPSLLLKRPDWWPWAECRDQKYKQQGISWFASRGVSNKRALEVCGICAARVGCLRMAVEDPTLVGIWGGTDDAARHAIRRLAQRKGLIPKETTP